MQEKLLAVLLAAYPAWISAVILVVPPSTSVTSADTDYLTLDQCVYLIPDEDCESRPDIQEALKNVSIANSHERKVSGNEEKLLMDFINQNKYKKICKSMKIITNFPLDDEYELSANNTLSSDMEPQPESGGNKTWKECTLSPLHRAVAEVVRLMKSPGTMSSKCRGLTPLDAALEAGILLPLPVAPSEEKYSNSSQPCNMSNLHTAIVEGKVGLLRSLVEKGGDIHGKDCSGLTPLQLAVKANRHEALPAFAHCQLDFKSDKPEPSLLHTAVGAGSKAAVETLIALGLDVNQLNKQGLTPLQEALINNKSDIFQILLKNGANVYTKTASGDTCVHLLSERGNVYGLVLLKHYRLLQPELVNSVNNQGETAMSKAVKGNFPKVLNFLLANGANADAKLERNESYMHLAVSSRSGNALRTLLQHCLPSDEEDNKGLTPILLAVKNDDTTSIELLSSSGADIYKRFTNDSLSLLHEAAKYGSVDALQWLLRHGLFLEERDADQWTALHTASWNGHLLVVVHLLLKGASVNAREKDEWTPLHMAARNGHLTVLRELIQSGADIHAKEKDGWMPIHMAARNGHLPVVQELLSNGALINEKEKDGRTPLLLAANQGRLAVVQELLFENADVEAGDKDGSTALHMAARNNNLPLLKELLQHSALISAKDKDGWTPLHLAAHLGHLEVMQELLSMKADVNAKEKDSWTPLHLAARSGIIDAVKLLLKHGADVNAVTKSGHTPLYYAHRKNHLGVILFLKTNGGRNK